MATAIAAHTGADRSSMTAASTTSKGRFNSGSLTPKSSSATSAAARVARLSDEDGANVTRNLHVRDVRDWRSKDEAQPGSGRKCARYRRSHTTGTPVGVCDWPPG